MTPTVSLFMAIGFIIFLSWVIWLVVDDKPVKSNI